MKHRRIVKINNSAKIKIIVLLLFICLYGTIIRLFVELLSKRAQHQKKSNKQDIQHLEPDLEMLSSSLRMKFSPHVSKIQ